MKNFTQKFWYSLLLCSMLQTSLSFGMDGDAYDSSGTGSSTGGETTEQQQQEDALRMANKTMGDLTIDRTQRDATGKILANITDLQSRQQLATNLSKGAKDSQKQQTQADRAKNLAQDLKKEFAKLAEIQAGRASKAQTQSNAPETQQPAEGSALADLARLQAQEDQREQELKAQRQTVLARPTAEENLGSLLQTELAATKPAEKPTTQASEQEQAPEPTSKSLGERATDLINSLKRLVFNLFSKSFYVESITSDALAKNDVTAIAHITAEFADPKIKELEFAKKQEVVKALQNEANGYYDEEENKL